MRVGLMVPCYIDVFYPKVGIAALELLEKLGVEVAYPFDQTCCAQPMANSGCESDSARRRNCSSETSPLSNTSLSRPAVAHIMCATSS
jgi:Fe-S oxidoreductase